MALESHTGLAPWGEAHWQDAWQSLTLVTVSSQVIDGMSLCVAASSRSPEVNM